MDTLLVCGPLQLPTLTLTWASHYTTFYSTHIFKTLKKTCCGGRVVSFLIKVSNFLFSSWRSKQWLCFTRDVRENKEEWRKTEEMSPKEETKPYWIYLSYSTPQINLIYCGRQQGKRTSKRRQKPFSSWWTKCGSSCGNNEVKVSGQTKQVQAKKDSQMSYIKNNFRVCGVGEAWLSLYWDWGCWGSLHKSYGWAWGTIWGSGFSF